MTRFSKRLRTSVLRLFLPSMAALRVATFSLVVFGSLALLSARSVYADMREVALGVGHQLASLEDLTSGAYLVHINGADIYHASAMTELPMKEVLDRYQSYCQGSPSVIGRAMMDIPKALEERAKLPKTDPLRWGIVRQETRERGMVVCFVDDTARAPALRERVKRFVETHDLSVFGQLRYVFVEPRASGGSRVVTAWTDGKLDIDKMFPASGDVPGADSAIVPRPENSRRTFNAYIDGYPAAVRIYESADNKALTQSFFDRSLSNKGFRKVQNGEDVAYVAKDGSTIFISLVEDGQQTIASIVESGKDSTLNLSLEKAR